MELEGRRMVIDAYTMALCLVLRCCDGWGAHVYTGMT